MTKNRLILIIAAVLVVVVLTGLVITKPFDNCVSVGKGLLYPSSHYLAGTEIPNGFDDYGFNYKAGSFRGYFINYELGNEGLPPYEGDAEEYLAANTENGNPEELGYPVSFLWEYEGYKDANLYLNWNEAFLSSKDCDGDGLLDHPEFDDYPGSGAVVNFHIEGTHETGEKWSYKAKIVAVPLEAYDDAGIWYDSEGNELGASIWTNFYFTSEVLNDPLEGQHGSTSLATIPLDINLIFP